LPITDRALRSPDVIADVADGLVACEEPEMLSYRESSTSPNEKKTVAPLAIV
ncbi:MAG: hypothetical protein F6K35_38675, partial [Okeania sp. SIO2H7]|nr:hypothetical protein [Okeania sp. SIO2H7]